MAPLDDLSAPGTATYDSGTMIVGDGTWDYTKNEFLLPNLVGLNLATTQYNGMGNRFSTLAQYHTLIKAHGILGALVFLLIIPAAIFFARFYTRRQGFAIQYHAYLQILAVLLTTVVFMLGWFAVGPHRSLTNPHHGIGVAIYTLILVQIIGGRLISNIRGRSLRVMLHHWFGRVIALLGIAQVPLGLALYGSPTYTFVLYALWMSLLVLLYFIFSYRAWDRADYVTRDGHSQVTRTTRTERTSKNRLTRWLVAGTAVAGSWAWMRGRNQERERSQSRSRRSINESRGSRARSRSRSRTSEVLPSRRASYIEEEKYTNRYSETLRKEGGARGRGGFMDQILGVGAGLGAVALIGRMMGRRIRQVETEYSAVATDTPKRKGLSRPTGWPNESEESHRDGSRSPILPGPGSPLVMAAAISAAEARPGGRPARPVTPLPSHQPVASRAESPLESDYSSYVSPSRRGRSESRGAGAAEKGLLAGLGLGWVAKRVKDRRRRRKNKRLRLEDEERVAGQHSPRFTGDGFGHSTPTWRRDSRRHSTRLAPPPKVGAGPSPSPEESLLSEPPPPSGRYGPSLSPLAPTDYPQYHATPPSSDLVPHPVGHYASLYPSAPPLSISEGSVAHSRTRSRHNPAQPAVMPDMPPDPKGILAQDLGSDSYFSRREGQPESRRREGVAAAAASSAGLLAAEMEAQKRVEEERTGSRGRTPPVSVKVEVHDGKDRNVTLRRLTEEEAMAARRARRKRNNSVSSLSGSDVASGSRSRYRRDTSGRRAVEEAVEAVVEPLYPPQPSFAAGRRPKSSTISTHTPAAGATVSSLVSPGSYRTWSGMSAAGTSGPGPGVPGPSETSAAMSERRRRRRMERRNERPAASGTSDLT